MNPLQTSAELTTQKVKPSSFDAQTVWSMYINKRQFEADEELNKEKMKRTILLVL
jgi:hypothetical protein